MTVPTVLDSTTDLQIATSVRCFFF